MTIDEHRARHVMLHSFLDELIADFLTYNRTKLPSTTTVMELITWSNQQTLNPTIQPTEERRFAEIEERNH